MKKLIAGFMTALMALLTVASPVLAVPLGNYPDILAGADGTLDAYVVIGSDAAVADVVGAVDLASRLAEVGMATTTESCPGAAVSVDGISKDTVTIQRGYLDSFFPGAIRSFHYDKLDTSTFSWGGNSYDYYEDIYLGSSAIYTSHDFATSGINGTQTLVIPTNTLKYRYVFKKALDLGSKTATYGTIANPEYSYPINIQLLGQTFQIVGLGANQVKMLAGSVGTATATTPVVYEDYSVYSDLGSDNTWARVIIKDAAGNTVDTLVINEGSDKTSSAVDLTIKVTDVRALQDGTVVGADVVVGAVNAVEKTYPATCDISGTGTSDYKFPGETEWCIQAANIQAAGNITVNDRIEVVYKPTSTKYIKQTDTTPYMALPNGFGNIGFVGSGWNYDTWTTLTFTPVTGRSAYWDDGMTGATNSTLAASNLNGIEIASSVPGSIVNGTNGYDKAYILFNYTLANGSYPVMVGFWDSVNGRIAVDTNSGPYIEYLDNTGNTMWDFTFNISYSNGAATTDQQYLFVNVTAPGNTTYNISTTVNGVGSGGASYFADFYLGRSGQYNNSVLINYVNKTATWTTSAAPEFRLFSTTSAEAKDVQAYTTAIAGNAAKNDIGVSSQSVVTDSGAIVVTPNTYSGSDIVKVQVPAQVLYANLFIGELGGTTGGGDVSYDSYPSVPITSAIAKLDTEMTALKTAKNVVLVGGPCINDLVAELANSGKFDYTCDTWPGRDFGLIQAIDDAFATGKVALVVAGTRAQDTRVATSALQMYDTILSGETAEMVEVTGTVGAPVVS
jgi:hypothetical protein